MKVINLKKIIFLSISILIGVIVNNKNQDIIIPSDAIRMRIIANSNNIEDLFIKKNLKDEIKDDIYSLIKDVNNNSEAGKIIKNNLNKIESIVSDKVSDFKLDYGLNYFPKKSYRGVIYPEGEYESLVITLGKGIGENWWCVLYPPLCLIDDNNTTSDVEYRSLIYDFLNN